MPKLTKQLLLEDFEVTPAEVRSLVAQLSSFDRISLAVMIQRGVTDDDLREIARMFPQSFGPAIEAFDKLADRMGLIACQVMDENKAGDTKNVDSQA